VKKISLIFQFSGAGRHAMSATTIFRKIAHPTARQPRFVFDALHVAVFHFYFRLAWLGGTFLVQGLMIMVAQSAIHAARDCGM
jgi:hypothetical protein